MFESPETYKVLEYIFTGMAGVLGIVELPQHKFKIKIAMWVSLICVVIFGIISDHLNTQENNQAISNSKKTLVTSQKILDSVSKQLAECKASIVTTNNYYNTPSKDKPNVAPNYTVFVAEPTNNVVHFDKNKDALYFTNIIDTATQNHKLSKRKYSLNIAIYYQDDDVMLTYAKELRFYLREKYKNTGYSYVSIDIEQDQSGAGATLYNGKYVAEYWEGDRLLFHFMLTTPPIQP